MKMMVSLAISIILFSQASFAIGVLCSDFTKFSDACVREGSVLVSKLGCNITKPLREITCFASISPQGWTCELPSSNCIYNDSDRCPDGYSILKMKKEVTQTVRITTPQICKKDKDESAANSLLNKPVQSIY